MNGRPPKLCPLQANSFDNANATKLNVVIDLKSKETGKINSKLRIEVLVNVAADSRTPKSGQHRPDECRSLSRPDDLGDKVVESHLPKSAFEIRVPPLQVSVAVICLAKDDVLQLMYVRLVEDTDTVELISDEVRLIAVKLLSVIVVTCCCLRELN